MKSAQNNMNKWEFIIEHCAWGFISMIWYKNILFRCIGNHTFFESKLILWGFLAASSLIGICLEMNRKRNGFSVFMNLAAGYGFYTIFTYIEIRRILIVAVLSVVSVLSVVFAVLVMSRKIKNRQKLKGIMLNRILKVASATQTLFSLGFALIMIVSGVNIFFGSTIMNATVGTATSSTVNEQTISNNIETVILLQEDSWDKLTVKERLNVLQIVANIEQRYLGLPNELNVGAANLLEGVMGYYSDTTHEIVISMDSLLNDSSWELLDTVCHEAYHSYQRRMVEAYNKADENSKNLKMFRKADSYAGEFDNYFSGEEDFCSYYYQNCESDARDYAEDAVYDYYIRINEYLLENPQ